MKMRSIEFLTKPNFLWRGRVNQYPSGVIEIEVFMRYNEYFMRKIAPLLLYLVSLGAFVLAFSFDGGLRAFGLGIVLFEFARRFKRLRWSEFIGYDPTTNMIDIQNRWVGDLGLFDEILIIEQDEMVNALMAYRDRTEPRKLITLFPGLWLPKTDVDFMTELALKITEVTRLKLSRKVVKFDKSRFDVEYLLS